MEKVSMISESGGIDFQRLDFETPRKLRHCRGGAKNGAREI
jgi:hypothetical protein